LNEKAAYGRFFVPCEPLLRARR